MKTLHITRDTLLAVAAKRRTQAIAEHETACAEAAGNHRKPGSLQKHFPDLAKVTFRNGTTHELVLPVAKLAAWARLLPVEAMECEAEAGKVTFKAKLPHACFTAFRGLETPRNFPDTACVTLSDDLDPASYTLAGGETLATVRAPRKAKSKRNRAMELARAELLEARNALRCDARKIERCMALLADTRADKVAEAKAELENHRITRRVLSSPAIVAAKAECIRLYTENSAEHKRRERSRMTKLEAVALHVECFSPYRLASAALAGLKRDAFAAHGAVEAHSWYEVSETRKRSGQFHKEKRRAAFDLAELLAERPAKVAAYREQAQAYFANRAALEGGAA